MLQLITDQLKEMKSEISAPGTRQEVLKSERSTTTTELKSEISAICTGKEVLKSEIIPPTQN